MLGAFKNKYSLLYLISIPVLLLIFALALNYSGKVSFVNEVNPYFKSLPGDYTKIIDNNIGNDSSFFSAVVDYKITRELVICKAISNRSSIKTEFTLDIFPSDKKLLKSTGDFFNQKIKNDAALFNYNGRTYGLFRHPLPLINIDKINIKQKDINKEQKGWSSSISKPFDLIPEISAPAIQDSNFKKFPSPYTPVFTTLLKEFEIGFLPHELYVIKDSLYHVNTNVQEFIDHNELTLGYAGMQNQFWKLVNDRDKNLNENIKFEGNHSKEAHSLFDQYFKGELELSELFDLKKLSYFLAISTIFSKECSFNFSVLYNPEMKLVEPFFMGNQCLGEMTNYLSNPDINNSEFLDYYLTALQEVSEIDILELAQNEGPELKRYIALVNQYYVFDIFDINVLNINQRVIRKSLNPTAQIKVEILEVDNSKLTMTILNMSNYPIEIRELNHKTKKIISALNPRKEISRGSRDTITIELPRSFENLFVSKKKKLTGFNLFKHFPQIFIGYSIIGSNDIKYASVIPYQTKEVVKEDLFRTTSKIKDRDDIVFNEKAKTISFSTKDITIDEPLIIPKGYTFVVRAGTNIDIVDGGKIISYAPLSFEGTQQEQILFNSSDKKGQGLLIMAEGEESQLKFVKFNHLTNPKHGNWSVTGALSFYESPAKFVNVVIENNRCEDALNMIRTTFHMRFCRISNTQSDAFDGDFIKGNIIDCNFNDLGNDAIDISGSELIIKRVVITNAGDKGLSAGENSKMDIENVKILDSEIGIAGKDLSIVEVKDLEIVNTKLAFTAFQKKPEFGPSHIKVDGIIMTDIETKYLIENTSSLVVDGEKVETSQNVKDRMYGVEFGRSSAETNTNNQ